MSSTLLDVSQFPRQRSFRCDDGAIFEVKDLFMRHYEAVMGLAEEGLIRSTDSFGFVMCQPMFSDIRPLNTQWNDPYATTWFAGGWGDNQDRYIGNAARKLRALLRRSRNGVQHTSTLQIRYDDPEHFEDWVPSADEDGNLPWGDFPFGGAAIVQMGNMYVVGAVSALSEIEDDTVVRLILGSIAKEIAVHNDIFPRL